jgi:hypothetical protein
MPPKLIVSALLTTFCLGGVAVAADALVVSDEERLDELADDLTDGSPEERVDGVLRWTDLSRVSLQLESDGRTRRYEDEDGFRLADAIAEVLAPLEANELDVVQRSVRVDGDRATVSVRVRADGSIHDVTFQLVRNGQGWLVRRLVAS